MDAAFKIVMRALDKPEAKRQKLSKVDRAELLHGFHQMMSRTVEGKGYDSLIGWNNDAGAKARDIARRLINKQDFAVLDRYNGAVSWGAIVKERGPQQPDTQDAARQMEAIALTATHLADMRECLKIVEGVREAADEYLKKMSLLGAKPPEAKPRRTR